MKWFLYYLLFQIVVSIFFWIYSKRKDTRYKARSTNPVEGYERTEEVSIDPVSQVQTRVYVNPTTGDRIYVEELISEPIEVNDGNKNG